MHRDSVLPTAAEAVALDAAAKQVPPCDPLPRDFTAAPQCEADPAPWVGQTFTVQPDIAIGFLALAFPAGPWHIVALDPLQRGLNEQAKAKGRNPNVWGKTYWPDTAAACRAEMMRWNAMGLCVYTHVNEMKPVQGDRGTYFKKRAGKANIRHALFNITDRDPHARETPAAVLDSVRTGLARLGIVPTFINSSGRGVHVWLRMKEPQPVDVVKTGQDQYGRDTFASGPLSLETEHRSNWLAQQLGGDLNCSNIDRVLKVPGFISFPNADKFAAGAVPTLASIIECNAEQTYTPDQLKTWDGGEKSSPTLKAASGSAVMRPSMTASIASPRTRRAGQSKGPALSSTPPQSARR